MFSQAGGQPSPIQSGNQAVAVFEFKNFGQTPAHDVEMFGNVEIVPWPIKDLPPIDLNAPRSRQIIGPGGIRKKYEFFVRVITPQEWASLNNGMLALVFYGEVRYVDAFNRSRTTRYRFFSGGQMGVRGLELGEHDEGNSYT